MTFPLDAEWVSERESPAQLASPGLPLRRHELRLKVPLLLPSGAHYASLNYSVGFVFRGGNVLPGDKRLLTLEQPLELPAGRVTLRHCIPLGELASASQLAVQTVPHVLERSAEQPAPVANVELKVPDRIVVEQASAPSRLMRVEHDHQGRLTGAKIEDE